jgi:hypothetical protein
MHFPGYDARSNRRLIRWELFIDPDLKDVLTTSRADTLRVVFRGEARFAQWTRIIVEAGFPKPEFGGPPADATDESLSDAAA